MIESTLVILSASIVFFTPVMVAIHFFTKWLAYWMNDVPYPRKRIKNEKEI